jgi:peptide/nickel transport system ATP-binding protein/oligopeptide transport system ATP-binding protein
VTTATIQEVGAATESVPLIDVRNLRVDIFSTYGMVYAVRGLDLQLEAGDSVAILGESGSGKSVTARAILGLLESPPAEVSGEVLFEGKDILRMPARELQAVRGVGISLVFQDALASLDPVMTVGKQLSEVLRARCGLSASAAKKRAIELMVEVGITDAEHRYGSYPHEFSGGMRQRICIALAISTSPRLLIADEPTTALDVTVQAEILRLIAHLRERFGMALIFVTHDLTVAREVADKLVVMYAGNIVESGPLAETFERPLHPYTAALLRSHPASVTSWRDLKPIGGTPADGRVILSGCAFRTRCPMAQEICAREVPELRTIVGGRKSRCHFAEEVVA